MVDITLDILVYMLELSEIYDFADFCHYDDNWTHLQKKII